MAARSGEERGRTGAATRERRRGGEPSACDLNHNLSTACLPPRARRETGWRVRVLTSVGPSPYSVESLRKGWSTGDGRTVVVLVDPTAPNIMSFKYGLGVQGILNRAFFAELQSRYGNLFAVREQVGWVGGHQQGRQH